MINYEKYMNYALKQALKAYYIDEVPVGAVIVKHDKIISKAYNKIEKKQCATFHAEMIAIQKACKKLGSWRLNDCNLYVTLQPCQMCMGAIVNSRINKLIFGAVDPKFSLDTSNYKIEIISNILEEDCSHILKKFFKELRMKGKNN